MDQEVELDTIAVNWVNGEQVATVARRKKKKRKHTTDDEKDDGGYGKWQSSNTPSS